MSGLYNLIHGVSPATWYVLPMLGKHPDEYPRFRDCFLGEDRDTIVILTRVGGGNRNCGYGEELMENDPLFIRTWDWDQDNTYGFYEFKVPNKWKSDFNKIINDNFTEASDEYVDQVMKIYPKIADKLYKVFRQ